MKKLDLGQSISILANVGVIAGIVFLGIELQQNTAVMQGATYQAMSDSASNQIGSVAHEPVLAEMLSRVYSGNTGIEEFTTPENIQLYSYYFAMLQRLENTYHQYQAGLADDLVFDSYGWNDTILLSQHFHEFWNFVGKNRTSPEFNDFLEGQIELGSAPWLE